MYHTNQKESNVSKNNNGTILGTTVPHNGFQQITNPVTASQWKPCKPQDYPRASCWNYNNDHNSFQETLQLLQQEYQRETRREGSGKVFVCYCQCCWSCWCLIVNKQIAWQPFCSTVGLNYAAN